jgi:hypothetical protein
MRWCASCASPRTRWSSSTKLFELEDVQLTFTDEALEAIAKKAIERKTGARGLRSIVEGMLLDTMFDLPTLDGVDEVVVDKEWSKAARNRFRFSRARKPPDPGEPFGPTRKKAGRDDRPAFFVGFRSVRLRRDRLDAGCSEGVSDQGSCLGLVPRLDHGQHGATECQGRIRAGDVAKMPGNAIGSEGIRKKTDVERALALRGLDGKGLPPSTAASRRRCDSPGG